MKYATIKLNYCQPGSDLSTYLKKNNNDFGQSLIAQSRAMLVVSDHLVKIVNTLVNDFPDDLTDVSVVKADGTDIIINGPDEFVQELVKLDLVEEKSNYEEFIGNSVEL